MPTMLPAIAGVSCARVNWGRWVVDCAAPGCRSALTLPPGTSGMICLDCGARADILWPADAPMIEALLSARPLEWTRNWNPGEPTTALLAENLAHGVEMVSRPELGAASGRVILDESGRLHLLEEALIIDAAPRMTIGA